MKQIIVIGLFNLLAINSFAFGWGDWDTKTPYGNSMQNYSGNPITLHLQQGVVEGISRWYFYKGHVIGELGSTKYFIANESTSQVEIFTDKKKWNIKLNKENLNPTLWTRWYDTDWKILDDKLAIIYIVMIGFPVLCILLVIWFVLAIMKQYFGFIRNFRFRKIAIVIMSMMPIFLLLQKVLEEFPSSI